MGDSGDVVPTASVNQPLALLNCGDGPRVILHVVDLRIEEVDPVLPEFVVGEPGCSWLPVG